jgi:hypothetical protein
VLYAVQPAPRGDRLVFALENQGGRDWWPALAATLTEAHQAGHDGTALLHRAVDERALDTADSLPSEEAADHGLLGICWNDIARDFER